MHLYEEIEQHLLNLIQSGTLRDGDRIPNEMELASRFSASRPTVRQALSRLTMDGRIVRVKGRGSFVSKPKLEQEYTRFISSYREEVAKRGFQPLTVVIELERVRPREEIAEFLGLSKDEDTIKLTRLRFLENQNDGKPVVFTTVYLPEKLCPWLLDCNFEYASLYETLEERKMGIRRVRREIEIRLADKRLERLLEVPVGSPVFFLTSKGYLENGQPMEYSESCYPSESTKFIVEIDR